ncbi:MAG: FixH family protein, partial [Gemmatimonadaceae bacterium]|nr:FixH family protein [Gemmatimonadaceae bacterium]
MKRGAGWPLAVAVILGATVAGNVWLIRLAGADPSFAVEEDYYRKGVRWDEELAQRAHNEALGWRVRATLSPIEPGRGADLLVALDDSAVAPIADASIVVCALHVGRAAHPVDVTLRPGDAP